MKKSIFFGFAILGLSLAYQPTNAMLQGAPSRIIMPQAGSFLAHPGIPASSRHISQPFSHSLPTPSFNSPCPPRRFANSNSWEQLKQAMPERIKSPKVNIPQLIVPSDTEKDGTEPTTHCTVTPKNKFFNPEQFEQFDLELSDLILEKAPRNIQRLIKKLLIYDQSNDYQKEVYKKMFAPNAILLEGPTGTGKITMGRAIAQKTGRPFKFLPIASCLNKFQFCREQFLKTEILPLIEKNEPCVIVIDDIDQLAGGPANDPSLVLCQLMNKVEHNPNFVFIATTNNPDGVPVTLRNRFQRAILSEPDYELRFAIFKHLILSLEEISISKQCREESFLKKLAKMTQWYSIRDLEMVVSMATNTACTALYTKEDIWSKSPLELASIFSARPFQPCLQPEMLIEAVKERAELSNANEHAIKTKMKKMWKIILKKLSDQDKPLTTGIAVAEAVSIARE